MYFGSASATFSGPRAFAGEASTLCFDLHDGSAEHAPRLVLWVDGENGAHCDDFTTLTEAAAYGIEEDWDGSVGSLAKDKGMYLYQAGGITADPAVALWSRPASSCVTVWEENSEWQRLCEPMGGAYHFRIEDIEATTNSRYFYLVLGEEDEPEGAPASVAGDGKIIVTGGRNHMGASWTWFGFEGETSSQFSFSNDDGPLYTAGPTTVCAEAQDVDGSAHLVFWASGAGEADCHAPETLTLDNSLHVSSWDEPLATDKWNYVKRSNAGIVLSRVVVSNTRRVL